MTHDRKYQMIRAVVVTAAAGEVVVIEQNSSKIIKV